MKLIDCAVVLSVFVAVSAKILFQVEELGDYSILQQKPQKTGCECICYGCGCCLYVKIPDIHLDDTGE